LPAHISSSSAPSNAVSRVIFKSISISFLTAYPMEIAILYTYERHSCNDFLDFVGPVAPCCGKI
jgi:hypothetical protein